jgi:hypothetical protein
MIELLLPCGFDSLDYSWVKATIGICTHADYSVAKKCQQWASLSMLRHSWLGSLLAEMIEYKRTRGNGSLSYFCCPCRVVSRH